MRQEELQAAMEEAERAGGADAERAGLLADGGGGGSSSDAGRARSARTGGLHALRTRSHSVDGDMPHVAVALQRDSPPAHGGNIGGSPRERARVGTATGLGDSDVEADATLPPPMLGRPPSRADSL